ncbi:MAG: hypothetical protein ACI85U_003976 [Candidatus Promineifilaceae bacterium]|jgi:hypothetical protein
MSEDHSISESIAEAYTLLPPEIQLVSGYVSDPDILSRNFFAQERFVRLNGHCRFIHI